MPIRHAAMLASRASIWPRDHFCRSTIAPRRSRPTTWNEFLPISMPIVATLAIDLLDMAMLRLTSASLAGQEHGRTIPLAGMRPSVELQAADAQPISHCRLFDRLVGAAKEGDRDSQPERLGRLHVDQELNLGGLLHGQIGRLLALENASSIDALEPIIVRKSAAVAHQ